MINFRYTHISSEVCSLYGFSFRKVYRTISKNVKEKNVLKNNSVTKNNGKHGEFTV